MKTSLPKFVVKYFWGDDLSQLNWSKNSQYITKILLEKGDLQAVTWLMKKIDKKELLKKLGSFKLSPKSDNYWRLYLS